VSAWPDFNKYALKCRSEGLPEGKMKSLRSWQGWWWISWFGIIGGFLMIGISDIGHESTVASHFSVTLMTVTVLLWIAFFIADDRARKRINGEANTTVVVDLLTMTGTFLAVFTLLGIEFFVVIAPRVP
jgi:hypothetical protein